MYLLSQMNHCFVLSSNDVIHGFFVNSLKTSIDVLPGILNYMDLYFNYSGFYFINCRELCGVNHSSMPLYFVVK